MSSMLVKAYLHPESDKQEIRRVYIDEENTRNYTAFLPTVTAAFPDLKNEQTTKLYWKDKDNELVSLSTDSELTDALANQSANDTVRVYLKTKDTPSKDDCISPDEWWKGFQDHLSGENPEFPPCARGWFGRWFTRGWGHPSEVQ